jgi:hypothetical protein
VAAALRDVSMAGVPFSCTLVAKPDSAKVTV